MVLRCIAPGCVRVIHQTVILINVKVFTKSHFAINYEVLAFLCTVKLLVFHLSPTVPLSLLLGPPCIEEFYQFVDMVHHVTT